MEDFPGNSQRARRVIREEVDPKPQIAEPKKLEKVVVGEVIRRKKPLGKRIRETFLGGDGVTVWEFVSGEIIIPAIRDMFADAATGGIERMLYPEGSRSAHRRIGNGRGMGMPNRVNYNGFAQQPVGRGMRDEPRSSLSRRARATHNFEEILLASRPDAEMVLEGLFDILDRYDQVAVSDLYELLDISVDYPDRKYGWTDLRGSNIERTRQGYLLNLPRPEPLER